MSDQVCITCGDVAVTARIIDLLGDDLATVDVEGRTERISVALVDVGVGECVLVHAGEAIAVVPEMRSHDLGWTGVALPVPVFLRRRRRITLRVDPELDARED